MMQYAGDITRNEDCCPVECLVSCEVELNLQAAEVSCTTTVCVCQAWPDTAAHLATRPRGCSRRSRCGPGRRCVSWGRGTARCCPPRPPPPRCRPPSGSPSVTAGMTLRREAASQSVSVIGLQLTALYGEGAHGGVEREDVQVSLTV